MRLGRSPSWHIYLVTVNGEEDTLPYWSEQPVSVGDLVPFKGGCAVKVDDFDWSVRWADDPQGARSSDNRIFRVLHCRFDPDVRAEWRAGASLAALIRDERRGESEG